MEEIGSSIARRSKGSVVPKVQTLGGNYGGGAIKSSGAAVPVVQNGEGSDGVAARWE